MEYGYLLCPLIGYFCGSVPFGYLVARRHGVNILEKGSGNIGATNVSRVLGKKPGFIVFVLDLLKGTTGVLLSVAVLGAVVRTGFNGELAGLLGGTGAILGHNFTCWLKFRGGKGIATTAGVLLGLTPITFLVLVSTWAIIFKLSRYVSLASIICAVLMPVVTWYVEGGSWLLFGATLLLGILAIVRHRTNIQRLINGTENRFGKTSGSGRPAPKSGTDQES